jgi:hypothetical protein
LGAGIAPGSLCVLVSNRSKNVPMGALLAAVLSLVSRRLRVKRDCAKPLLWAVFPHLSRTSVSQPVYTGYQARRLLFLGGLTTVDIVPFRA